MNRSAAPTRLTLRYLPAPGTPGAGGPRVGESLEAGQELRVADVVAWLRENGYAFPASGPAMVGTLRVTFEDVEDSSLAWAGSRTSTPNPNTAVGGSFGLFLPALPTAQAPSTEAVVVGLREDASFRSNLAVVDVPPGDTDAGSPARLSVQLFDGDTGSAAGAPIEIALSAGEWRQLDRILARVGCLPRLGEDHPHRGLEPLPRLRRSQRRLRVRVGHLRRQPSPGRRHGGARPDRPPRHRRSDDVHDAARPGEPDRDRR